MTPQLLNWLRTLAAERTRDQPHLYDDLVQEAAIAVWSVTERWPEAPRSYLIVTAKKRMAAILSGRSLTGEPNHQGRRQVDTSFEEAPEFEVHDSYPVEAGDVHAAVRQLNMEDRQIVYERYWLDRSWPEVAATRGVPTNRVQWRWTNHIRPTLQGALA